MKKIAIIGAGLQASRRLPVIAQDNNYQLSLVIDHKSEKAEKLVKQFGGTAGTDWKQAVQDPETSAVMILTYPDSHAEIAIEAMRAGKDVLCEKPLSRTVEEARDMVKVAKETGRILKCGFNHRHHPAILEAHKQFQAGVIGKPVFARGRYGIAGREGVEKEWRSDPKIVSGGQLMEQGIHLVDLFRWFLGDMQAVTGMMSTTHWPLGNLEDNGFVLMKSDQGIVASVHSSLTQWINLFEFEVYGEKGSLTAHGLGTSYGVEKLTISEHDPNGPFSYKTIEYRGGDKSWNSEWVEFTQAVESRQQPMGNGEDGLRAMEIVMAAYQAAATGQTHTF